MTAEQAEARESYVTLKQLAEHVASGVLKSERIPGLGVRVTVHEANKYLRKAYPRTPLIEP